jgi:glycine/D-amino acid oxidase-like deaminating enzyme
MTKYGRSPWIDRVPASQVPSYSRHRGRLEADVVIVGGGLTGCMTAYALSAADVRVALVEADRIGRGSGGSASGWISDDPGVAFGDVERALGLKAARHAWRAWHRAALDFGALVRRLPLKCDYEARTGLLVATTAEQTARLTREQKTRKAAGLEAPLIGARGVAAEAALTSATALRLRDGGTFDPYRAAVGLAAAAAARGARLFEGSPALRTTFARRWAEVRTPGGVLRGGHVVIATGMPTPLFKSLVRHVWFHTAYLALTDPIPARIRTTLGRPGVIVRDLASPAHLIRWVDEERLLVMGADGAAVPSRLREKAIVQRTGQLMYELSTTYPDMSGIPPAYGWDVPYARTAEGLPYIGPHRNFPRHLFAFAGAAHSETGAYLASRILLRHVLGEAQPEDQVFGFGGRLQ